MPHQPPPTVLAQIEVLQSENRVKDWGIGEREKWGRRAGGQGLGVTWVWETGGVGRPGEGGGGTNLGLADTGARRGGMDKGTWGCGGFDKGGGVGRFVCDKCIVSEQGHRTGYTAALWQVAPHTADAMCNGRAVMN